MAYTTECEVRYRDLDPRKHVNHAVYVTFFEEAKADYFENVLGVTLDEAPTMVRALDVEYRDSITFDQSVTIDLRVTDVGETSFTIEYELRADGGMAATGRTVSVYMTDDLRATAPVPSEWRSRIDES